MKCLFLVLSLNLSPKDELLAQLLCLLRAFPALSLKHKLRVRVEVNGTGFGVRSEREFCLCCLQLCDLGQVTSPLWA